MTLFKGMLKINIPKYTFHALINASYFNVSLRSWCSQITNKRAFKGRIKRARFCALKMCFLKRNVLAILLVFYISWWKPNTHYQVSHQPQKFLKQVVIFSERERGCTEKEKQFWEWIWKRNIERDWMLKETRELIDRKREFSKHMKA